MSTRHRTRTMACAYVAVICTAFVVSAAPVTELVKNGIIVAGEVVDVHAKGTAREATMRITQVYRGPESLAGKVFTAGVATGSAGWGAAGLWPPPEPGEKAIWLLARDETDRISPVVGQLWRMSWPVWQREDSFVPMQEVAKLLKRLNDATEDQWADIAREEIGNTCEWVSACAIDLYAELQPNAAAALLRSALQAGTLGALGQTAADAALCDIDAKEWIGSKARGELMDKWVGPDMRNRRATRGAILRRVQESWARGQTGTPTLLRLMRAVIEDPEWPLDLRRQCCWYLGNVAKREKTNEDAFAVLLGMTRQADPASLRLDAASVIVTFAAVTETRAESLRAVLADVKDPRLAEELRRAIAKYRRTDTAPAEPTK